MSLSSDSLDVIDFLKDQILQHNPTDVVQFCANHFTRLLELQRSQFLSSINSNTKDIKMSGNTFPGRFGSNANPFGGDVASNMNEVTSSGQISKVMEEDENDTITSPTTPSFGFKSGGPFGASFGGDAPGEGPPSSFKAADGFPSQYGMGRRTSVSAESLNPTAASNDNWTPPYHQKTEQQLDRLKKSISGNFLFSHLDDEQSAQVLGALVEKAIPAKGIKVCAQG